jgi:hypothetical protein
MRRINMLSVTEGAEPHIITADNVGILTHITQPIERGYVVGDTLARDPFASSAVRSRLVLAHLDNDEKTTNRNRAKCYQAYLSIYMSYSSTSWMQCIVVI